MTVQAFGSWSSPIKAADVAKAGRRLSDLQVDPVQTDVIYWIESRPEQAGRACLMRQKPNQQAEDVLPSGYGAKSNVYEYGGAPFCVYDGVVWFVNAKNQALCQRKANGGIIQLTPGRDQTSFADLVYLPKKQSIIAVCETSSARQAEPSAEIIAIGKTGKITTIARGHDFYASPRLSNRQDRLVWLAWNHPNMPWHENELWQAQIEPDSTIQAPQKIKAQAHEALFGPLFSPDDTLYIVSDADNWWNIYQQDGDQWRQVTHEKAEFGLPQWVFGQKTCAFTQDGALYALSTADGLWRLGQVDLTTGAYHKQALEATFLEQLVATQSGLACIASDAATPKQILRLGLSEDKVNTQLIRAAARLPEHWPLSKPEPIRFTTADHDIAYGLYYAPKNMQFTGPEGAAPPLLLKCHGGPTGQTDTSFDARLQYWTSRGFAVFDVNYRGSTGYGREYRNKLDGAWGVADIQDCEYAVRHLADQGLINPEQVFISGSSAGGYTVLSVLAFSNIARAGASYYGIGDLSGLLDSTHKFESRYLDRLVGRDKAIFKQRSPLMHVHNIDCPVLFLQGLKDKVVPPSQAQSMVDALKENNIPVAYITFEDEKHGFRNADNMSYAIDCERSFYQHVLQLQTQETQVDLGL